MDEFTNPQLAEVLNRLQMLEQENAQLKNVMLQSSPIFQSVGQEPSVSLPERFDGTREKLRTFISQVKLLFELQPRKYSTDKVKVGLTGTLLTGVAAAWFCPLFENNSPVLQDFNLFVQELQQTFGDYDREITAANKIRMLRQGDNTASQYTAEFRMLASDLDWGENALIDQFRRGLNDNVKDLLITLPLPSTLTDIISSAVKCDNRIRERASERKGKVDASVAKPGSFVTHEITPMEIVTVLIRKKERVIKVEKFFG